MSNFDTRVLKAIHYALKNIWQQAYDAGLFDANYQLPMWGVDREECIDIACSELKDNITQIRRETNE